MHVKSCTQITQNLIIKDYQKLYATRGKFETRGLRPREENSISKELGYFLPFLVNEKEKDGLKEIFN